MFSGTHVDGSVMAVTRPLTQTSDTASMIKALNAMVAQRAIANRRQGGLTHQRDGLMRRQQPAAKSVEPRPPVDEGFDLLRRLREAGM